MKYDVIIVGCGVAGMTAAIYLKRSGLTCAILESTMPGGQIVDNGAIENYPGFLKIKGSDLALDILNQVKKLEIPIFYESVLEISLDNEVKNVKTKTKNYQSTYIIIATERKPKH